jgi:hypothetical protein
LDSPEPLTTSDSLVLLAMGVAMSSAMLAVLTNWRGFRDWHLETTIRFSAATRKGPLRLFPDPESESSRRFAVVTQLIVASVLFVAGLALTVVGAVTLVSR